MKSPHILFLILAFFICCMGTGSAAIIDVGEGYSYTTIASGMTAASSGDFIHVHPGTYTISSTIQPSKTDLTLYGDGYNNTIIEAAAYDTFSYDAHSDPRGSMIYVSGSGANGFEIYGFKIDGGCADNTSQHDVGGTTDGGSSITVRGGATYISIHDIYFTLGMGDCVFGGGSSHVDVYNCIMLRPGHDGIQLWGSTTWNITNCIIDRQTNSGIRLATDTKNINISRVTMYTTLGGGYADIEWEGADSGNTVDHCVFNAVGPVIADYSGSGTMGFTNNICYNIALPSNPTGSVTLSPNTGNQYTTTTWDWVAAGYGYNPAGVVSGNGTGEPMATYNGTPAITLTYPTNGSSETTMNGNTTFTWLNVNSSSYRIVVANNSSFATNNTIYNQTTSASSISLALSQNETYWWKVQGKIDTNNTWTNYTTPWTFTVVGNREIAITSGIYGYIYDTSTTNVIAGAVVTIMNNSWSDTYVTKSDGYYEFSVPRGSGVYYLRASATDYQTSPDQLPLNLTGEYVYENIALTKSPSYFLPHYVTLTVTDIWGNLYENVSITIYRPADLESPYQAGYTDSSGSATFALNQTTQYTIVLYDSVQNIDRTLTLTPADTAYNLWVWGAHKVSNNTIDELMPNVSTDSIRYIYNASAYNLTHYSVNVSIRSVSGLSGIELSYPISSYNITIWQINENNGTQSMINNTSVYHEYLNGTGDISTTFYVPRNASYIVQSWVLDPDYDQYKPAYFFNRFYASDSAIRTEYRWFGWENQWNYTVFTYCLMLMAAGLFGRANAHVGALLVGFIGMFSWHTGWIAYSLGDKIMAMFGILVLIIYLLTRKD